MAERDDKAKAGGDEPCPLGPAVGSPVPSHLPVNGFTDKKVQDNLKEFYKARDAIYSET